MRKFDVNCFAGQWPFHSTRFPSCQHIVEAHKAAGICGGLITSLQSVFYADPLTAAKSLSKELPVGYGQVFAINPLLPAAAELCKEALEKYHIKGIRLTPTYHTFNWYEKRTQNVLDFAKKYDMPIFITLRLEDHRLDYMAIQRPCPAIELSGVLNDLPDVPVILTNIAAGEITHLRGAILRRKDIYVDTSFFNSPNIALENAVKQIGSDHIMFGSAFNRLALGSSVANVMHAELTEEEKEDIWHHNAERIFGLT